MEGNLAYKAEHDRAEGLTSSYFNRPTDKREELVYRVEQEIAEELQPPLKDISHGFAQGLADTIYGISAEQEFPNRKDSLDYFDRQFMKREITRVKGNLTQYVRDAFGAEDESQVNNLRRNVYRKIWRHGLGEAVDSARPWKQESLDEYSDSSQYLKPESVADSLSNVLEGYKEVIQPSVYEGISEKIQEKATVLADKIAPYVPTPANRLKEIMGSTEGITNYNEAKAVFEKQIVYDALSAAGFDKKKAAGYLGDSLRTLNRRIAELGVEDKPTQEERADNKVTHIEDFVKKKQDQKEEKPSNAVNEIERFQQIVREYNAKRESERLKKPKKEEERAVA